MATSAKTFYNNLLVTASEKYPGVLIGKAEGLVKAPFNAFACHDGSWLLLGDDFYVLLYFLDFWVENLHKFSVPAVWRAQNDI